MVSKGQVAIYEVRLKRNLFLNLIGNTYLLTNKDLFRDIIDQTSCQMMSNSKNPHVKQALTRGALF